MLWTLGKVGQVMVKARTVKQQAWVEAMLIGCNPTEAARRAKYSQGTEKQRGHENVTNSDLMAEIDRRKAEIEAKTEYTIKQWLTDALAARKAALERHQYSAVAAFDRLIGQHKGVFELDNKQKAEQRQLSEKQKEEARRFAQIRLGDVG